MGSRSYSRNLETKKKIRAGKFTVINNICLAKFQYRDRTIDRGINVMLVNYTIVKKLEKFI